MLEALPDISEFFFLTQYYFWYLMNSCSVLAGFLALAILDRIFHIFDILRR